MRHDSLKSGMKKVVVERKSRLQYMISIALNMQLKSSFAAVQL